MILNVFVDGSYDNLKGVGGYGVVIKEINVHRSGVCVDAGSSRSAEMFAIYMGLLAASLSRDEHEVSKIRVHSDSQECIDFLRGHHSPKGDDGIHDLKYLVRFLEDAIDAEVLFLWLKRGSLASHCAAHRLATKAMRSARKKMEDEAAPLIVRKPSRERSLLAVQRGIGDNDE